MKQEWIKLNYNDSDRLPTIGDYSVLGYFDTGSIETIHVEDMFGSIGNGRGANGEQLYTRWYIECKPKLTHWMELPNKPID